MKKLYGLCMFISVCLFIASSFYFGAVVGYLYFLLGGMFIEGVGVFKTADWALFGKEVLMIIWLFGSALLFFVISAFLDD